jgi:hypothetical protein
VRKCTIVDALPAMIASTTVGQYSRKVRHKSW